MFNGWTDLDVLSAFTDTDGSLMVFDTEGTRYHMPASDTSAEPVGMIESSPDAPVVSIVSIETGKPVNGRILPDGVDTSTVEEETIRQAIAMLDKNGASFANIRARFVREASAYIAILDTLDKSTGGPDWRESIGIETVP